jgi:pyruvate dehydrogenase E2 component (dihydrolipoamide acetyltransferase)
MPFDFKLSKLGENIASADIAKLLVREGDQVQPYQTVMEVMADKASIEIQTPQGGRIAKVHVQEGQTVPIGSVLLTIEPAGVAEPARTEEPPREIEKSQPAEAPPRPGVPGAEPPRPYPAAYPGPAVEAPSGIEPASSPLAVAAYRDENGGPTPAGPATRRFARELGVDLHRVRGTGPGGRITREDIIAAVRQVNQSVGPAMAAPAETGLAPDRGPSQVQGADGHDSWGPVRREPLSSIRKVIAANMARSNATIPHVTNFDDADITELEKIRKGSMADYVDKHVKLTMMAFVLKAVAHSLKLHPAINAALNLDAGEVVYKQYVNLGIAVDTERGLVVPVMRGVDQLSIPQIAQALMTVAGKARQNQFSPDDVKGGTFTISNLGAIGGTYSTPIINHPEVAILLVGRSRKLPVVIDEQIKPRLMMPLSLSYDHRWIDGATAARFLNEVKDFLESPGRLLLAP